MLIDLRKTPDVLNLAFTGEEPWLAPIYDIYGNRSKVSGSIKIQRQHRGQIYDLTGHVQFEPIVECVRCCQEIPWKIDAQIKTQLIARQASSANKINDFTLSSPELNEYEVDSKQPTFDLTVIINDTINEAIPSHVKCEDLRPQDPMRVCELPNSNSQPIPH